MSMCNPRGSKKGHQLNRYETFNAFKKVQLFLRCLLFLSVIFFFFTKNMTLTLNWESFTCLSFSAPIKATLHCIAMSTGTYKRGTFTL